MDNIKDNNKGFSLVEMIVSVLISAILTLALAAFMMTSRAAFMKVAAGSKLQEEALAAENFMNEIFMEATKDSATTETRSQMVI